MSEVKETREEWLVRVVAMHEQDAGVRVHRYLKEYFKVNRGAVLSNIAEFPKVRGLKSYFIDNDLAGLKQSFYVASKLIQKSQEEGWDSFGAFWPFLYGLHTDSPEIYEWLACAQIKDKSYVKDWLYRFHQFQLVLQCDDDALRESIAIVSKKGGNRDRVLAKAEQDFFSLLLKKDKEGLQRLIENAAKIKSEEYDLVDQFLAGYAVILAKLCWYRGIEVEIKNPLVPMPLMPIRPLEAYDVEYDFLRPGWTPPSPPGLLAKVKRLLFRPEQ